MAKTHQGDCVDIDPFIPTGRCSICTSTPQDTTVPEDRPVEQVPEVVTEEPVTDPTPEEL